MNYRIFRGARTGWRGNLLRKKIEGELRLGDMEKEESWTFNGFLCMWYHIEFQEETWQQEEEAVGWEGKKKINIEMEVLLISIHDLTEIPVGPFFISIAIAAFCKTFYYK